MLSKWQTHLAKQQLNCIEFYMQISLFYLIFSDLFKQLVKESFNKFTS